MDLAYPPEAEEFRSEIAEWLKANLPEGWGGPGFSMTPDERKAFNKEWTDKLYGGGWICASWPTEYGGKGLSLLQQVVLNEEFARAGAPLRADFFGDTLVGPTILQWGTEEQKQQFIPGILKGEIAWCQGFSEPDAGSDLAGLKTRAELDGDEWVINGQKVWTTQAQYADYIFLLARTDPDAPKHAGISYLLVPMKQPGVEVRPIEQVDGSAEFNEVFFTNVRCPKDNVIGGVNNGWKVAMTTLGFERGTSSTTGHRRFQKEFDEILAEARRRGRASDPLTRQRLARSWSKIKIMQINGFRTLDRRAQRHAHDGGARCMQQDVLVGGAPGDLAARDGHPRHGRPDPAGRRGRGQPAPRGPAGQSQLPRQQPAVTLLLLALGDHLGRDGRDPTEHCGRAGPRPPQGTETPLGGHRPRPRGAASPTLGPVRGGPDTRTG